MFDVSLAGWFETFNRASTVSVMTQLRSHPQDEWMVLVLNNLDTLSMHTCISGGPLQ